MADISRYKGGARKPNGSKQSTSPRNANTMSEARASDTRRANPASGVRFNSGEEPNRRAINLDTGATQEEIPIAPVRERARQIQAPRGRLGNWEVESDDDRVKATRRFKAGGIVKGPDEMIEFTPDGRKRRVRNRPQGGK